jgi:hypothetical protein
MKPQNYNQLVFDKGIKIHQKLLGKLVSSLQKLKLDPCLSPYTTINSKWIKDLNIRPQTLKVVQERVENILELIGIGKDFLSGTPATKR